HFAPKQLAGARQRIDASDIAVAADRFAKLVGEMHAAVNHDVMAFRNLTVIARPRPTHLDPHGTRLANNQLWRWWWFWVMPEITVVSAPLEDRQIHHSSSQKPHLDLRRTRGTQNLRAPY